MKIGDKVEVRVIFGAGREQVPVWKDGFEVVEVTKSAVLVHNQNAKHVDQQKGRYSKSSVRKKPCALIVEEGQKPDLLRRVSVHSLWRDKHGKGQRGQVFFVDPAKHFATWDARTFTNEADALNWLNGLYN
jgi:hypothetical protein